MEAKPWCQLAVGCRTLKPGIICGTEPIVTLCARPSSGLCPGACRAALGLASAVPVPRHSHASLRVCEAASAWGILHIVLCTGRVCRGGGQACWAVPTGEGHEAKGGIGQSVGARAAVLHLVGVAGGAVVDTLAGACICTGGKEGRSGRAAQHKGGVSGRAGDAAAAGGRNGDAPRIHMCMLSNASCDTQKIQQVPLVVDISWHQQQPRQAPRFANSYSTLTA